MADKAQDLNSPTPEIEKTDSNEEYIPFTGMVDRESVILREEIILQDNVILRNELLEQLGISVDSDNVINGVILRNELASELPMSKLSRPWR